MKKSTLRDVALEAKVGTATVERVLNGRGGVAAETADRVVKAARKLRYGHRIPEQYHGAIRIEVILVRPDHAWARRRQPLQRTVR